MIRELIYFILPIGVANMMPVIVSKVPYLNFLSKYPIDNGVNLGKDRLFGKGKTWGGIVSAVLGGIFVACAEWFWIGDGSLETWWAFCLFNGVLALGAILGDLAKSFLKRRLMISSGASWPIFDQVDFIFGAYIFAWLFGFFVSWEVLLWSLVIVPPLHLAANLIAYFLGLKKVWW